MSIQTAEPFDMFAREPQKVSGKEITTFYILSQNGSVECALLSDGEGMICGIRIGDETIPATFYDLASVCDTIVDTYLELQHSDSSSRVPVTLPREVAAYGAPVTRGAMRERVVRFMTNVDNCTFLVNVVILLLAIFAFYKLTSDKFASAARFFDHLFKGHGHLNGAVEEACRLETLYIIGEQFGYPNPCKKAREVKENIVIQTWNRLCAITGLAGVKKVIGILRAAKDWTTELSRKFCTELHGAA